MHQKPDADAMGSSLGLTHFLRLLGHQVTVISPTNWAKWLDWMPGCNEVIDFSLPAAEPKLHSMRLNGCFASISIFSPAPNTWQKNYGLRSVSKS